MIGIDIVKVERISRLKNKFGEKFLNRFLCKDEISLVKNNNTLAGFWAVKEAAAKALGYGIGKEISFLDMKISKNKFGAPKLKFKSKKIKKCKVSISHDGGFAVACVFVKYKKN